MTSVPKRLLLDLTLLGTPGGARGIGRYARELARGLCELPAPELEGIELIGLLSVDWSGKYSATTDIAGYLDQSGTKLLEERDYYSWAYRQRLVLWRAAKQLHADAIHLCDPHATPRFLGLAGAKKIVTCTTSCRRDFPSTTWGGVMGERESVVGSRGNAIEVRIW